MRAPITYRPERDPGGAGLQRYLAAELEAERWHIVRMLLGVWLAVAALPCWVMAAFPGILHGGLRGVALVFFAIIAALYALSVVAEGLWRRRQRQARDAVTG